MAKAASVISSNWESHTNSQLDMHNVLDLANSKPDLSALHRRYNDRIARIAHLLSFQLF